MYNTNYENKRYLDEDKKLLVCICFRVILIVSTDLETIFIGKGETGFRPKHLFT